MKKFLLSAIAATALSAAAADLNPEAVITHIEALQWKISWDTYNSVDPQNCIYDSTNEDCRAFVSNGTTETYIYYGKQIIFPEYGNYITMNLNGLNLPDGDYELTIPEGYVRLSPSASPNLAQYLNFTIGEDVDSEHQVIIKPLDGNTIDIYWDNVTSLAPYNTTGAYMVNTATNDRYELYYLQGDSYSKANLRIVNDFLRVNLTNNYPDLPDGRYQLYIPADYVKFNGTSVANQAINGYEFKYSALWSDGVIEFNGPTDDGIITATWKDATEVYWNTEYTGDGWYVNGITVYDGNDDVINVPYPENVSFSGNVMTVDLKGLDVAGGNCNLLIPEDCIYVTINGVTDLTFGTSYHFDYGEPAKPDVPEYELYPGEATWSIGPNATVTDANNPVSVSWTGAKLTYNDKADDDVNLYGTMYGYFTLKFGEYVRISDDGTQLLIDLRTIPQEGYRLNVPEALLILEIDGQKYYNTASSVETIFIEITDGITDAAVDLPADGTAIYNLQGIRVNASDLPAGIYIVNGKKVLKF